LQIHYSWVRIPLRPFAIFPVKREFCRVKIVALLAVVSRCLPLFLIQKPGSGCALVVREDLTARKSEGVRA
jgi:hypothetical protein